MDNSRQKGDLLSDSRNWSKFGFKTLTSYLKRCVAAEHFASHVLGHTPVDAAVLLLLAMHRAQEEQRAGWQQNSMRFIVIIAGLDRFAVLVPLDDRVGLPFGLAIQCDRLVFRHNDVAGMLRYARRTKLCCK